MCKHNLPALFPVSQGNAVITVKYCKNTFFRGSLFFAVGRLIRRGSREKKWFYSTHKCYENKTKQEVQHCNCK